MKSQCLREVLFPIILLTLLQNLQQIVLQTISLRRWVSRLALINTEMEQENNHISTAGRQAPVEYPVSVMAKGEKETFNGEPTPPANLATDGGMTDTTDVTPGSVKKVIAASHTGLTEPSPADDYLNGLKLAAVLAAVTMAAFLMILDLSVVVTVRFTFIFL